MLGQQSLLVPNLKVQDVPETLLMKHNELGKVALTGRRLVSIDVQISRQIHVAKSLTFRRWGFMENYHMTSANVTNRIKLSFTTCSVLCS